MIDALRFVQGAVADKDYVPELTHFRITAGHIMGFNGRLALCSPIDLQIDAAPKAKMFIKALAACGDKTSMHLTPKGRLAVKSGGLTVYVECIDDYAFDYYPVGDVYATPAGFLEAIKDVTSFIGQDASRPWSMAVHLEGGSAYATNNIIAVERWIGANDLPPTTIPHFAIKELLRIGIEPISIQIDNGNSITFWFGTGKWMRTQLVAAQFPTPQFVGLLDKIDPSTCYPVDQQLVKGLERIKPFTEGRHARVLLLGDRIATDTGEAGAVFEAENLPEEKAFNLDMLSLAASVANKWNLESEPAHFLGNKIRGVLMGLDV